MKASLPVVIPLGYVVVSLDRTGRDPRMGGYERTTKHASVCSFQLVFTLKTLAAAIRLSSLREAKVLHPTKWPTVGGSNLKKLEWLASRGGVKSKLVLVYRIDSFETLKLAQSVD